MTLHSLAVAIARGTASEPKPRTEPDTLAPVGPGFPAIEGTAPKPVITALGELKGRAVADKLYMPRQVVRNGRAGYRDPDKRIVIAEADGRTQTDASNDTGEVPEPKRRTAKSKA